MKKWKKSSCNSTGIKRNDKKTNNFLFSNLLLNNLDVSLIQRSKKSKHTRSQMWTTALSERSARCQTRSGRFLGRRRCWWTAQTSAYGCILRNASLLSEPVDRSCRRPIQSVSLFLCSQSPWCLFPFFLLILSDDWASLTSPSLIPSNLLPPFSVSATVPNQQSPLFRLVLSHSQHVLHEYWLPIFAFFSL